MKMITILKIELNITIIIIFGTMFGFYSVLVIKCDL